MPIFPLRFIKARLPTRQNTAGEEIPFVDSEGGCDARGEDRVPLRVISAVREDPCWETLSYPYQEDGHSVYYNRLPIVDPQGREYGPGYLHRTDGPAVECPNKRHSRYFLFGVEVEKEALIRNSGL